MKKIKFYHFLPAIIFFCTTFYLFTLPGEDIPQISWFDKMQGDKLVHIGLFFTLVTAFAYPFNKSIIGNTTRLKWFLYIGIVGVLYGISIEFIQKFYIPGRSFGIDDMIADTIGCIVGYYCARRLFTNKI